MLKYYIRKSQEEFYNCYNITFEHECDIDTNIFWQVSWESPATECQDCETFNSAIKIMS